MPRTPYHISLGVACSGAYPHLRSGSHARSVALYPRVTHFRTPRHARAQPSRTVSRTLSGDCNMPGFVSDDAQWADNSVSRTTLGQPASPASFGRLNRAVSPVWRAHRARITLTTSITQLAISWHSGQLELFRLPAALSSTWDTSGGRSATALASLLCQ